jgi:hypothetical protein
MRSTSVPLDRPYSAQNRSSTLESTRSREGLHGRGGDVWQSGPVQCPDDLLPGKVHGTS